MTLVTMPSAKSATNMFGQRIIKLGLDACLSVNAELAGAKPDDYDADNAINDSAFVSADSHAGALGAAFGNKAVQDTGNLVDQCQPGVRQHRACSSGRRRQRQPPS